MLPASDPPRLSRAAAARINGARSRGPVTPEGKARSSRNALRHGLAARTLVLLPGEDTAAYQALEAELLARYAPRDAVRGFLVQQLAAAMWRLQRAAKLEAQVLTTLERRRDASFGTGDNPHAPQSWDAGRLNAVGRYVAQHERSFWRLLQALEAEPADAEARPNEPELPNEPEGAALAGEAPLPNEPEMPNGSELAAAMPNEPKLPPRAEPPCGMEVALLRQEVERLVGDEDWRTLEQGLEGGRYRPLGLEPLPEAS